jgi:hypothetical protein
MTAKIRTLLIILIAASSLGSALVPGAAQAATKQKDLTGKGYTCEHASDNLTICTDKEGHEWYCEESSDECGQVKLTIATTKLRVPVTGLYAQPVSTTPPVVVKVTRPVMSAR